MTNPAIAVTRIFRIGLRYSLVKNSKSCFAFNSKALYHSFTAKKHILLPTVYATNSFLYRSKVTAMGALSPKDPSSYSRPELAIIKHINLNLDISFEKKTLTGAAVLEFEALQDVDQVVLDVSALSIQGVVLNDTALKYTVDGHVPNFGSKLTVTLPQTIPASEKFAIKVSYTTDPAASALQWLEPSQTSGKQYPFLFSQCQPIHARSILPCQDSPAVKFTYEAKVSAPPPYTVLMSALSKERTPNVTTFHQPVPIPSYLLALAVGVLESRSIGPRTTIWSEQAEIDRSAWEFAHTEQYLQAAERLCGRYVWGQYDLLVLPPSFPYGGMENPCLTFVTPTLLAGDRSQADVIVHEIMHSWTGNLVTNENFQDFWLNEGFTVFLERKVAASLIADQKEAMRSRDFHSLLGLHELQETIREQFPPNDPLTKLVPDLNGIHPEDAFSRVPYEKGSLFLRYLEDIVTTEPFDKFMRAYLKKFERKSLSTSQFKAYLLEHFASSPAADKLASVDWQTWLYAPGMPPAIPYFDTSMTKAVTNLLANIEKGSELSYEDVKAFSPHQMINLLQELLDHPPLPAERLTTLGTQYKILDSHNSEIRYRWLRLCIKSKVLDKLDDVFQFINSQGRMKYVRPIYRDLYAWEQVRSRAIDNFKENERNMMHVSAYTIRKDLHLSEKITQKQ